MYLVPNAFAKSSASLRSVSRVAAVASTKRGKKHEDEFDREFNNLRISKPDLQREETEKAWAVLDDFGDDRDVRGNFMVVVELDVPERPRGPALRRGDEERADWAGRPDFKKFKKVRRAFLSMVFKDD